MLDGYWRLRPFAPRAGTPLIRSGELEPLSAQAFAFGSGPNIFRMFVVHAADHGHRGFLNLCPHASLTLDRGTGEFLTRDRGAIFCRQHCAMFTLTDGYCFEGACRGESLHAIELDIVGDWVCVSLS